MTANIFEQTAASLNSTSAAHADTFFRAWLQAVDDLCCGANSATRLESDWHALWCEGYCPGEAVAALSAKAPGR